MRKNKRFPESYPHYQQRKMWIVWITFGNKKNIRFGYCYENDDLSKKKKKTDWLLSSVINGKSCVKVSENFMEW